MGSGGRGQTAFLLEHADGSLLVDFGATAMAAMRAQGVDPAGVDGIVLSHLHGDHFGGIPFFLLDARWVSGRDRALVIAGPEGTRARVEAVCEAFYPGLSKQEMGFQIDWRVLESGRRLRVGGVEVVAFPVDHGSGADTYGLRLGVDDRVLAYSGDTEWTASLPDLSAGSDLFICEASFFEREIPHHLAYRTILEHREELGAKRLLLTHLSQEMLDRRDELEIEVAHDGLRIEL